MDLMGYDELDGDELDGDELDGDDVLGDDVLGMSLVGAARRRRAVAKKRASRAAKPRWRNQMAPGVPVPGYGVFPIPLTPLVANGIFTGGNTQIEFRAVAQIPFRGERLLARVGRVGPTALGSLCFANNGVHIGIRPQVGVLGPINLEDYSADAFGVRMVMQPATQGAEIRVFAFCNPAVTGTDTLALSLQILGRVAT
jgi:hypothetical protein